MFPYPSGAGLHVGHPLGYIASDIYSRYKRLKGFNVLHPMGYDAFGLPAEQYAIQTGQHPEITTEKNAARYRQQLDRIGFSYDWSREIRTCDPAFYKWTQWAFLKMFSCWYDPQQDKARPIDELIEKFSTTGYDSISAEQWNAFDEKEKDAVLMRYRIAYLGETSVNWCDCSAEVSWATNSLSGASTIKLTPNMVSTRVVKMVTGSSFPSQIVLNTTSVPSDLPIQLRCMSLSESLH